MDPDSNQIWRGGQLPGSRDRQHQHQKHQAGACGSVWGADSSHRRALCNCRLRLYHAVQGAPVAARNKVTKKQPSNITGLQYGC
jgi:hypothetical protein